MRNKIIILLTLTLQILLISCSTNQGNQATDAVDIIENFKNDGWIEYLQQDFACSETEDFCYSKDENLELRLISATNGPDPEISFIYAGNTFAELLVGHYFAFELEAFLFKGAKSSVLIVDEAGEGGHTLLFYKLENGEVKYIGEGELSGSINIVSIHLFEKESELAAVVKVNIEGEVEENQIIVLDLSRARKLNTAKVKSHDHLQDSKIATFNFSPLDADSMVIEVYRNESGADDFEKISFGLPIKIRKSGVNASWRENNSLVFEVSSCYSEGFQAVVTKGDYFTIEQQLCDGHLLMFSYMTFVYRDNEIYLHKYSHTYFDKADHDREIPQKSWTVKDFGTVKFEDVSDRFIINLYQNDPKK